MLMGAAMAMIMMGFMWDMYRNTQLNILILAGAILVFSGCLWLVRSQATVGDVSYMRAMIPHHSIALLTSDHAQIKDPEGRRLADNIIESKRREISEMKRHRTLWTSHRSIQPERNSILERRELHVWRRWLAPSGSGAKPERVWLAE